MEKNTKKKFSDMTKDLLIDQIRSSHFEFLDDLVEDNGTVPETMRFTSSIPFCDAQGRCRELCVGIKFNVY